VTDKPRKSVPSGVKTELWARAAGRCEFRGCNKLVFRDGLTKQRSNLSVISHIVAYWPGGPRGDAVRSPLLCHDIANLMLTCRDHAKLIDDAALVADYPEELLLEFKNEHEDRIARLTGIASDAQTRILILQAPINGRPVTISETAAVLAALPRYPTDERTFTISLNDMGDLGSADAMAVAARAMNGRIDELLRLEQGSVRHLSVFALAPIPLLVLLGRRLGDTRELDAFQRHRATQDWSWPDTEKPEPFFRREESRAIAGAEAAVLLSVSGQVDREAIDSLLPDTTVGILEIRARRRGLDFLKSRARLDAFAMEARAAMTDLHEAGVTKIHVFGAIPSPIAIEFGRAARAMNGELLVYEYNEGARCYGNRLSIGA
jgi:hypothetical protein